MRTIFLILLMPFCSFAQSGRQADVSNPVRVKAYTTSAGTFTVWYNSSTQRVAIPDKIDFIESTTKTSDGGTSTYIIGKEAYEESMENIIVENTIQVTVSPNPFNASTNFVINTDEDIHKAIFEVYDIFGRTVKSMTIETLTFSFEKNNLSDGFYLYRIKIYNETREEKNAGGKFIINSNQ